MTNGDIALPALFFAARARRSPFFLSLERGMERRGGAKGAGAAPFSGDWRTPPRVWRDARALAKGPAPPRRSTCGAWSAPQPAPHRTSL